MKCGGRTGPEDGAEEAAGVVRPERLGGGFGVLPATAGGAAAAAAAAGAAGALLVVRGGGKGGAEEDGLVDLRLAEGERQQRPRRVPLRRRQQRRRHGWWGQSAAGVCFEVGDVDLFWLGRTRGRPSGAGGFIGCAGQTLGLPTSSSSSFTSIILLFTSTSHEIYFEIFY